MKRRFFLAGILAAPVVAAAAPVAAKGVANHTIEALRQLEKATPVLRKGFTVEEIKLISDSATTYYLKDKRFAYFNPTMKPNARRSVVSLRQRSAA